MHYGAGLWRVLPSRASRAVEPAHKDTDAARSEVWRLSADYEAKRATGLSLSFSIEPSVRHHFGLPDDGLTDGPDTAVLRA